MIAWRWPVRGSAGSVMPWVAGMGVGGVVGGVTYFSSDHHLVFRDGGLGVVALDEPGPGLQYSAVRVGGVDLPGLGFVAVVPFRFAVPRLSTQFSFASLTLEMTVRTT
ncbi:MAG: hypothetical protein ACXW15_07900, partial [Acidimicrobiia bacterium]